ncbi:glycosyl-4,4'-diaponeurosporenoate acyltransferase [Staphylococcus sp. HMSC62A08]|uniref:glycosyl-4,4'-diaponeurosporenoate acyltransferase CrtO family protein n=2 Tax=Staphylococcus TaxID=1279 RepID=UPI003525CD3E
MMKNIKKLAQLVILHSVFWFLVQMSIAQLGARIPLRFFDKNAHFFRPFQWEKGGQIWGDTLQISKWKKLIPEGTKLNNAIYDKSYLTNNIEETRHLLLEMRRAELVHWLSMVPLIVFIKTPKYIKYINLLYVVFSHVPIIIVQRYNRPRIERFIRLVEKRGKK